MLALVTYAQKNPSVVVVAASAGGVAALLNLISELPADFPAPVIVLQHLPPLEVYQSVLPEVLRYRSKLPVKWIEKEEKVLAGTVYLCPQNMQTNITENLTFDLRMAMPGRATRPAADPLFGCAAKLFGAGAIGIILSGYLCDGAMGAREVSEAGGRVLAQDRATAMAFGMPEAAIRKGVVDFVLSPIAIAHALIALLMAPGADAWFRVTKEGRLSFLASQSNIAGWKEYGQFAGTRKV